MEPGDSSPLPTPGICSQDLSCEDAPSSPCLSSPLPGATLWTNGGVDLSTVRGPGLPAPLLCGSVASQCRAMVGESAPGVVREMWIPS
ncbi:unnamed protein product [Arctogadus glacialis]